MRKPIVIGSVVAIAAAGMAIAAMGQATAEVAAVPDVLLDRLNQGTTIDQYLSEVVGQLRTADRDEDGLDADDVARLRDIQRAQARAGAVAELLRQDLNGDLKVTRDEMVRAANTRDDTYRQRQIETMFGRYDANGDGTITIAEVADVAPVETAYGSNRNLGELLALDPNKDGKLTAAELRQVATRAFNAVDRDGDGKLSQSEFAAIADRVREAREIRMAPVCALPPVPAGARLVAFGSYEADAMSSVSVGGPEQETNLMDVVIEPGREPVYLVLTSYESMVWRLTGATDRVARVVVSSFHTAFNAPRGKPAAPSDTTARLNFRAAIAVPAPDSLPSASGVTGVAADRVTIATASCPRYFSNAGADRQAMAGVRKALGRAPDAVFATYSAQRVALPSGTITKAERPSPPPPKGFDPAMWNEASRYWAAGLVAIDPRQVVAKTKVERYQVLPSQMGLAQLIGSGAIERLSSGEFRIVRPIPRMPPSMGGAHSVTLVLAKGVPLPPGDPVHSCVIDEATGKPIKPGARCP